MAYWSDRYLTKRKISLWSGVLTIILVVVIEYFKQLGFKIPVPFLLIIIAVGLSSSCGGLKAGLVGAAIWAVYVIYALVMHFGPTSLTGGWVQAIAWIIFVAVLATWQGWQKDENDRLLKTLQTVNNRLQAELQERQKAEATLRETERRWHTLLDNVRLLVVGLDSQKNIDYVNPFLLEVTGYTQEEILGKNWFDIFLPTSQRHQVEVVFQDFTLRDFFLYHQNPILTKTGEERLTAWNNTVLRDPRGQLIGTLSIGEDVTERNLIARMKDEFVSVVSHELRTPLTSIHGALNLLNEGLIEPCSERGQRVITIAAQGSERLVRLVNDILDFERLSGNVHLLKQDCNLGDLMLQSTDIMQLMADQKGVVICTTPARVQIYADADRIIQVLTNLLSNAIKFSPPNSMIFVTAKTSVQDILIAITDCGIGIPTNHLETIFERFYQVDTTDARAKRGTGLGLAICRNIVQQHGGRIWAESVLGKGSRFCLTLPLKENE